MHTIIQITDLHFDNNDPELRLLDPEDNFNVFLTYVNKIQCDKVIVTGDVAEAEENIQTIANKLQGLCGNLIYVAGNHDPKDGFKMFNQKKPYFIEYMEEFLVIFLDSGKGIIGHEQLQWLNDLLKDNKKDILIFMHHPVLDCGNTVMDRMFPLINRSEVYSLLQNVRNKVYIFSGHYHWEQEVQSGNIKQYVTPSLLYQLDKNADFLRVGSTDFGFRVINISMNELESHVEILARK